MILLWADVALFVLSVVDAEASAKHVINTHSCVLLFIGVGMNCHCDSMLPIELCCGPLLEGKKEAKTALALMRSRYTAHVVGDARYILETYGSLQRANLTLERITNGFTGVVWKELEILAVRQGRASDDEGVVEFLAHYKQGAEGFSMHEASYFQKEAGVWKYIGPQQEQGE